MVNEKGTKQGNIEKKKQKVEYLLKEIKRYGDERKVGNMALEVRQKIYETVVVPTLFANIETWSKISETEIKELEKMQSKLLRGMYELPQCTPYWGILAETGIWPVECKIEYKKIMLLQNILQADEKRLVKEIIEDQLRAPYGSCWAKSILEICGKYELEIDEVRSWNKRTLKKEIKERINKYIDKKVEELKQGMKKLRFISPDNRNNYIKELSTRDATTIMKTRLNMLDLKANFRGKYNNERCDLCEKEEDNTEHLFKCEKLMKLLKHTQTVESLESPSKDLAEFIKSAMLIKCCVRL